MDDLLTELRGGESAWLVFGLLITLAVARAMPTGERPRLRVLTLLTAVHLALVVAAGTLRAFDAELWRQLHVAGMVLAGVSATLMAGVLVFSALLPRLRVSVPWILRDITVAGAGVAVVLAIASRNGFNLSGVIATSAVLTAVVGFSLQDTLGNVMGGLAVQLDRSIEVGDWIKVGDAVGRVTEIRWRYTAIETRNWETLIIPNSVITKGQVLVLGRRTGQPLQWRRWVWFNVDFRYPPTDVIHAVTEALEGRPIERVAADPPPHCILMSLDESTGRYAVRYWLTDLAYDDGTDSVVRTRVWYALKRAGIPLSIPAQALFVTPDTGDRKAYKVEQERARALTAVDQVSLFATLDPADRAQLAAGLRYSPFTRGEAITKQGSEAHWLYIIIEGQVVVRVEVDGGEREVARLGPGNFFGEISLMTGAPRSATVVALTDVECFRLDKHVFQEVITRRPELAEDVADVLAKRRLELEQVREHADHEASEGRLADTRSDLLHRIRSFFDLDERPRLS